MAASAKLAATIGSGFVVHGYVDGVGRRLIFVAKKVTLNANEPVSIAL